MLTQGIEWVKVNRIKGADDTFHQAFAYFVFFRRFEHVLQMLAPYKLWVDGQLQQPPPAEAASATGAAPKPSPRALVCWWRGGARLRLRASPGWNELPELPRLSCSCCAASHGSEGRFLLCSASTS